MQVSYGHFTNNRMVGDALFTHILCGNQGKFNINEAKQHYKRFLEQKAKSPTAGKVVEQYISENSLITYNKTTYTMRKDALACYSEIEDLLNTIKQKETLQAKTLTLRNKLIELNRISIDKVNPKLKGLKKLLLKLRVMF